MSYDPNDRGGYGQPPPQHYTQAPPYGYPQPPAPAKGGGCGKAALITVVVIAGLMVIVGVIGALAAGNDSGDTGTDTPAAGADGGQEVYAIGETAHTGDFDVTVHGIEDPFTEGTDILPPPAGHRFVAVEATIKNTGAEPQAFSTLAGVELFDQLDRPWPVTITASRRPSLDALTVAPGEARRGWVMFSVPTDATEMRIRIKGNLTANGSVFKLN